MGFLNLFKRSKPKIKIKTTKKDGFSGWMKCSGCQEMIHANELKENLHCCNKCGFHYRFSVEQRVAQLIDKGTFEELFKEVSPVDPLEFEDQEKYSDRIARSQKKTGKKDALLAGVGDIEGIRVALGVMDFSFMGGSMGSVVGEKITLLVEHAIKHKLGVILVTCSGGARMQESIFSLMQMAKTSTALAKLGEHALPYIAVLTNPTTGGVTASFATLGDVIVAEPNALIGFAGPRVVEQTIGQKLPPGAQRSEFLLENGMIDSISHRKDLKEKIAYFLKCFMHKQNNVVQSLSERSQGDNDYKSRIIKFLTAAVSGEKG